ncbi:very short patch repair endonuclease [Komagataeibacter swingsii]|uniref:Very short patch repair endonuclease n=1 Tax=Komagataeibacter swingsii TaxID=215220 RepID=A0A850P4P0_9PROT|nr:very short patch repair endonuclease [Komagataeibacter swingsii]NVN37729.1 DNA mismatch endonuclease Vsr [Komagataeibacter swingsii]
MARIKAKEHVSPERSAQMALVKGKNTKPELRVRRALHAAGFRYRLHDKSLPGHPDIVFRSRKTVIFVHGCFWHRHSDPNCKLARLPKSRLEFWEPKLDANAARDRRNKALLEEAGWKVITIWECQTTPSTIQSTIANTKKQLEYITSNNDASKTPSV